VRRRVAVTPMEPVSDWYPRRTLKLRIAALGYVVLAAACSHATPSSSPSPTTNRETIAIRQAASQQRYADENGLRYALTLTTPVVAVGRTVTVALNIENRTKHPAPVSLCTFKIVIVRPNAPHLSVVDPACPSTSGNPIAAGASSGVEEASTPAPSTPGRYAVVVEPTSADELPAAFLRMEPFNLQTTG
jgi:hypothetical protein